MKKGLTCGAMDLLHYGHLLMLKECKEHCDYLIVCLHTDPTLDRPSKNKPIETVEERFERLKACKYIDEIVVYDTEAELLVLLKGLDYQVRFIGEDYVGKDFTGKKLMLELGKEIYYNSRKHNYSTSNLRKRVCDAGKE